MTTLKSVTQSFGYRGISMLINFLSNVCISKILLTSTESGTFGFYAYGVGIALISPVLDLGIGQSVYNHYTRLSFTSQNTDFYKYIFRKLLFVSLFWLGLFFTLYKFNSLDNIFGYGPNSLVSNNYFFFVLVCYAISIPFSIGYKILSAIPRITPIILLQGIIQPLTLLIIIFATEYNLDITLIFYATPILTLLTNVIGFFVGRAQIIRNGTSHSPESQPTLSNIVKLAFWSVLLSLSTILITFVPRQLLSSTNTREALDHYSLVLMYLLPICALISTFASIVNPEFRRISNSKSSFSILGKNTLKAVSIAFFGSLSLFGIFMILSQLHIQVPSRTDTIFILILSIQYAVYFVPISALTEQLDLRFHASTFLAGLILLIAILRGIPEDSQNAYHILVLIFLIQSLITLCIWVRIVIANQSRLIYFFRS